VERDGALAAAWPALARAASLVATPPIRNSATLGGNLCLDTRCSYYDQTHEWRQAIGYCMKRDGEVCWVAPSSPRCWAVSSSDTAPVLCALDAEVTLASRDGERRIPVTDLFADDGIRHLTRRPDELLVSIHLPESRPGRRLTYLKLRRRGSFDFPVLGVAATVRMDGETVRQARIVLGAVASLPREAAEASRLLVGERLTPELIDRVADAAYRPAKPLDNTDLTHPYRKKMTRVYVARALRRLAGLPEDAPA
jgi:4-hydroxybenzoyl-CoA reductase subunit beta